jgi:hypothetical protein
MYFIDFLLALIYKASAHKEVNVMKRIVTIFVFVLGVILFLTPYAMAQDKVVVIPLFGGDATGGPPAVVEKSGVTTSDATGDDGDLQKGVAWPSPRFTDNEDGTVKDNLTGLIWLKDANCPGETKDWSDALTYCNSLASGSCGLTDDSVAGDWRLPNVKELHSLIDCGRYDPALPSDHPFINVQSSFYWSGSRYEGETGFAWLVAVYNGLVSATEKSLPLYVWPVRGGN